MDGSSTGQAMFVMDPQGRIYASNTRILGELHHSSLGKGNPVSAAGDIEVVQGIPVDVSNGSGHYTPSQKLNTQLFDELESRGMNKNMLDGAYRSGFDKDGDSIDAGPHKYFDDSQ